MASRAFPDKKRQKDAIRLSLVGGRWRHAESERRQLEDRARKEAVEEKNRRTL